MVTLAMELGLLQLEHEMAADVVGSGVR
jgi:hypothetical protein